MEKGNLRCDANVSVRTVGDDAVRHAGRDQEPELDPIRGEGHRARDRAAGRGDRAGRARSSRRRGCGTPAPAARSRCAARKRRTTIVISRSPTCGALVVDEAWIARAPPRHAGAAAGPARAASSRDYGLAAPDAETLTLGARARGLLRGRRGAGAPAEARRELGDRRGPALDERAQDLGRGRVSFPVAPGRLAGLLRARRGGEISAASAKEMLVDDARLACRRRQRSSWRRGSARIRDAGAVEDAVARGRRRQPVAGRGLPRRARRRRSVGSSARS